MTLTFLLRIEEKLPYIHGINTKAVKDVQYGRLSPLVAPVADDDRVQGYRNTGLLVICLVANTYNPELPTTPHNPTLTKMPFFTSTASTRVPVFGQFLSTDTLSTKCRYALMRPNRPPTTTKNTSSAPSA